MAALGTNMKKQAYFASQRRQGWPAPEELERYFLAPPGKRWFFETRNDGGNFSAEGLYGTGDLEPKTGRVDVVLYFIGHPELGVTLQYSRWDGRAQQKSTFHSRGDLSRLREFVRSFHGTSLSKGLFIPYADAWRAVKEFIETDGELPTSIEWVANRDLPPGTFPDP